MKDPRQPRVLTTDSNYRRDALPGLISVIIPCYNASRYIGDALESVFAQQSVSQEIILVDDGSQDGSPEFVEAHFPTVQVYRTSNQGPSAARNFGTARSRGEFIQYLDADDLLAIDKLKIQKSALVESNADVAYGDWLKFRSSANGTKEVSERVSRSLGLHPDLDLFNGFWCPPAAYLLRRSIVDRVGSWNPRLQVIQDARFMLDCALRGGKFVYCAGIMAEYRLHRSGSVSTRSRTAFLSDCLRSALEVQDWWTSRGELDQPRRGAIVNALNHVAAGSIETAPDLFAEACSAIAHLAPCYPSAWPFKIRFAVGVLGYRSAMSVAYRFRRCKAFFKSLVPALFQGPVEDQ